MSVTVSNWLCRCGMRIKVVAETSGENRSVTVMVACPKCGDEQTVYGDKLISVTAEKPSH